VGKNHRAAEALQASGFGLQASGFGLLSRRMNGDPAKLKVFTMAEDLGLITALEGPAACSL
jgi:hypothetical protein